MSAEQVIERVLRERTRDGDAGDVWLIHSSLIDRDKRSLLAITSLRDALVEALQEAGCVQ